MNEDEDSFKDGIETIPTLFEPSASSSVISDTDEELPIQLSQSSITAFDGSDASSGEVTLISMFRRANDKPKRNVTFADGTREVLACYHEPSSHSHWSGVQIVSTADIVENYFKACSKFKTVAQDSILNQLREIRNNGDYSATLNLTGLTLDGDVIETLETIFRIVTFRTISIDQCMSAYATDVLDMLEYYKPVKELILTDLARTDNNMWHSIASAISNSEVLLSVSFREMSFSDNSLHILFGQGINCSNTLKKIRFDACEVSRAPTFMLAHHLKNNEYIRELHLCYLDLYSKEADMLGKFLSINNSLRVLNLSNNKLGDHGFQMLSYGLFEQASKRVGVEVLILFNNNLTKRCVDTIKTIISTCPLVHTLNVGMNELTDKVIYETEAAIQESHTLRALGLQSTLLTCYGLNVLANTCENNKSLRHLNLRGNKAIQPSSLNSLADRIHNTSLIQIDLDDNNRNCGNPQKYTELVNKVRQVIAVNKAKLEEEHPNENQQWIQEPFLTCEPAYVPKSTKRLTRSSYSHRFSVVPVSEGVATPLRSSPSNRFTVVPSTSVGSGDFTTACTSTDSHETGKSNPTGAEKSINLNAGGDVMCQENNRSFTENIEEALSMEVEDEKHSIITVSSDSTDSVIFISETLPSLPEGGEVSSTEVGNGHISGLVMPPQKSENTGAAAPIPVANPICNVNERPMDENMDTTD